MITLFIILTIAFLVIRLMPGSIYDANEMYKKYRDYAMRFPARRRSGRSGRYTPSTM